MRRNDDLEDHQEVAKNRKEGSEKKASSVNKGHVAFSPAEVKEVGRLRKTGVCRLRTVSARLLTVARTHTHRLHPDDDDDRP